jgi:hypothetical protein
MNIHDDQDKHALERGRMNREKIDCPDVFVALEKALPVLGTLTVPRTVIAVIESNGRRVCAEDTI